MTASDTVYLFQSLADRSKNPQERSLFRNYISEALELLRETPSSPTVVHEQCFRFLANSCSDNNENRAAFFNLGGIDVLKPYCSKDNEYSALAFAVIHNCILDSREYRAQVADAQILNLAITYWIDWQHKLKAPFFNMLSFVCEMLYPFCKDCSLVFMGLQLLPSMVREGIDPFTIFAKAFDNSLVCVSFAQNPSMLIDSIDLVRNMPDFTKKTDMLNLFPRIAEHDAVLSTSLHTDPQFLDFLESCFRSDDSNSITMASLFIGNLVRRDDIAKQLMQKDFLNMLISCIMQEKDVDGNVERVYACCAALRHFMIPVSSRAHFAPTAILLQEKLASSRFTQLHYISASMIRLSMPYILCELADHPERFYKLKDWSKSPDFNLALESNRTLLAFVKHYLTVPKSKEKISAFFKNNINLFEESVVTVLSTESKYPIVIGEVVFVAILMIKHGYANVAQTIIASPVYEALKSYRDDPNLAYQLKQNVRSLLVLVEHR